MAKLLDEMRDQLRTRHYARSTEDSYVHWAKRYILFHNKRHPREMSTSEVEAFLTNLAVDERVSASTQNQALAGVLFLYRDVLKIDDVYEWLRIPVVDGSEVVSSTVFVHVKAAVDGDDSVHGR